MDKIEEIASHVHVKRPTEKGDWPEKQADRELIWFLNYEDRLPYKLGIYSDNGKIASVESVPIITYYLNNSVNSSNKLSIPI